MNHESVKMPLAERWNGTQMEMVKTLDWEPVGKLTQLALDHDVGKGF